MVLRRVVFAWLIPAAFVLPLWLLIGWGISGASGWALLWVLAIAMPSVFLGQFGLTLLVRLRPSVRAERAVSWPDVAAFVAWHALTVALGFFGAPWWGAVMVVTVLIGLGAFWLQIWQLVREVRQNAAAVLHTASGVAYIPAPDEEAAARQARQRETFVISEVGRPTGYPHPGNGR